LLCIPGWLALKSWSSCLHLPSAGITGMHYHVRLYSFI
jgi:hypothetical protein